MLYSAESNASLSLKQSSALLKYVRASHPISVNNAYYCSGCRSTFRPGIPACANEWT